MLNSLTFGIMQQALEELISSGGEEVEGVVMAARQMINHWSGSVGTVEVLG